MAWGLTALYYPPACRIAKQLTARQANVMLAYPIEDAETLLDGKLATAKKTMATCEEDLDFLREQVTVRF